MPDPLPPFFLGTGEWTKQDTGEDPPTTPSHENKVNHPFSPTSDKVISTLPRKDMWKKSNKGRSSNKISISPLLSNTDVTSQENSFLLDSPDNECSDSPVRRIAGSVGCGVSGSASWRHPLTPPGRTGST